MLGCVIDSAPGPMGMVPYFTQELRITNFKKDAPWLFPLFTPIIYGYFERTEHKNSILASIWSALRITPALYMNWLKYGNNEWAGNYLMNTEREKWPLCFIYSQNDKLMAHTFVDRVVQTKIKQDSNRIIIVKKFKESGHVAHYKMFPNEYVDQVSKFLLKCCENKAVKFR